MKVRPNTPSQKVGKSNSSAEETRKRRDRRQDVLAAATRLFYEQGFHPTTMDDIADAVKLNKGTLYYYYESKANILFDLLVKISERHLSAIRRRDQESPVEAIRAYVERTAEFMTENIEEVTVNLQESPFLDRWLSKDQFRHLQDHYREAEQVLKDLLQEAADAGEVVYDDPTVVTHSVLGMVSWLPRWYKSRGRMSAAEIAKQMSALVLDGLRHTRQSGRLGAQVEPKAARKRNAA